MFSCFRSFQATGVLQYLPVLHAILLLPLSPPHHPPTPTGEGYHMGWGGVESVEGEATLHHIDMNTMLLLFFVDI